MFKSGFVSIVGNPNAGKSTLLNNIVNQKVSIVSDKVQTTRDMIKGIYNEENLQIVFLDTPGFHKPKNKLQKYMNEQIDDSLYDIELIIYVVDASFGVGRKEREILDRLKEINVPKIAFVNKIDIITQDKAIRIISELSEYEMFDEILAGSSLKSYNVDGLLHVIKRYLPEGVRYYEDEQKTDMPLEFQMAEIIREKVLYVTFEEIPHSIGVKIMEIEKEDEGLYIRAVIYVQRESQKGIIIGKKAAMIKKIGVQARKELQYILDEKVYLDLTVQVMKNWQQNDNNLNELGYHKE